VDAVAPYKMLQLHNRETGNNPVRSRRCNWGVRFGKVFPCIISLAIDKQYDYCYRREDTKRMLIHKSEDLLIPVPKAPRGLDKGAIKTLYKQLSFIVLFPISGERIFYYHKRENKISQEFINIDIGRELFDETKQEFL
jgi:hypothetical protein